MAKSKQVRTDFGKPVKNTEAMTNSTSPASSEIELLQFKIPKNLKREFRQLAIDEEVNLTELFLLMFQAYQKNN